ncbi:MAG: hypothetical protein WCV72_00540 [Patescibacteria group bacterium]|jgi:hypothetical protein
MPREISISQELQKVIAEHEKELRANYKKMLARFNRLRRKLTVNS